MEEERESKAWPPEGKSNCKRGTRFKTELRERKYFIMILYLWVIGFVFLSS